MSATLSLRRRRMLLGSSALLAVGALRHAAADLLAVKIGGTGSGLGVMRALSELFRHETKSAMHFDVLPSLGSGGGIKALRAGVLDIAIVSRPLEPGEQADFLQTRHLGKTPIGFAARSESAVSSLTIDQVAMLYSDPDAELSPATKIRLILRHANDIDTAVPASLSPRLAAAMRQAAARKGMFVAATDQDAADAIENIPGAFGVSSLCLVKSENRKIAFIALNGISPSVANVEHGSYSLVKPLILGYRREAAVRLQTFLQFLDTPAARKTMRQLGVLPH